MQSGLYRFNEIINARFNQKEGLPQDLLRSEKQKFDLIISNMPIGVRPSKSPSDFGRIDFGLEIILKSLDSLENNGLIIFPISDSFFKNHNSDRFRKILSEKGYRIRAIFETPINSINQNASIQINLLIIEKGEQKNIFLAEVNNDDNQQIRTIENFRKEINSKRNELSEGILRPLEQIAPISKIKEINEINILLKRTGLPLSRLCDLGFFNKLSDINDNFLIISKNPNKKVILGSDSFETSSEIYNYYFQVNTNIIEPYYLMELLNSPLGNKILNSINSRSILSNITKTSLEQILLPVDSLPCQNDIIEIDRNIKNTVEKFKNLHIQLWKDPKRSKDISKEIRNNLKDPNSIEWMEELPFPIASILWGYYSESKVEKKVEYLFLFFEGLCEFIDILLLSALHSNESYFNNNVKDWIINKEMKEWHKKASFGGWKNLHEKLAKNIRVLQKKDSEFISKLFACEDSDYISLLTSKELVSIFIKVNNLRNNNKGHGGISSESHNIQILKTLEEIFYTIKDKLIAGFSNVNLLSPVPKTADWDDQSGVHETTCLLLKGTRSKFNQIVKQTRTPLSSKKLYLLSDNQFVPIEVLPLIQMRETPKTEQNACFFYNRIDGDQVRLVSYHFDQEAELFDPILPISSVFKILNPTEID